MHGIEEFSEEILMMIFNNIESMQQLATCRLVTKTWRSPAAAIMFSRNIVVDSETKAIRLYRHLLLDPAKARHITNMRFEFDGADIPSIVEELLELAITPSIKNINGAVKSDEFFTKIFTILENASQPYDKLESLPKYTGKNKEIKKETELQFYPTLISTLSKNSWCNLSRCHRLNKLTVKGDATTLHLIEKTLNSCLWVPHLEFVDLSFDDSVETMSVKDVKAWCQANVQKNDKCKQLDINTACHPQLLEYLSFKYPLGNFSIKGALKALNRGRTFPKDNLKRILAVDRLQSIKLIMPASTKMKDVALFFRNQPDVYKFYMETIKKQEELILDISNYNAQMHYDYDDDDDFRSYDSWW